MKLTKINIKGKAKVMTLTVEMEASELYRLVDMTRSQVERGGDFRKVKANIELAEHLDALEKRSGAMFEDAEKAAKAGIIRAAQGDFANTEA